MRKSLRLSAALNNELSTYGAQCASGAVDSKPEGQSVDLRGIAEAHAGARPGPVTRLASLPGTSSSERSGPEAAHAPVSGDNEQHAPSEHHRKMHVGVEATPPGYMGTLGVSTPTGYRQKPQLRAANTRRGLRTDLEAEEDHESFPTRGAV